MVLTFSCLCFFHLFGAVAPPLISPFEVYMKSEEILRAHARYKNLDQEIVKRILVNFLEEIDPLKSYLTKQEVNSYLYPSEDLLKFIIEEYKQKKFSLFYAMYETFITSINRRNVLESELLKRELPKQTSLKDFQESTWAENSTELQNRLLLIKSLQHEASMKLTDPEQHLFFQRITKKRLSREKELIGNTKADQKKLALACFLKAMASSLDTHTIYFTPQEAKQFLIQVQQRLFGIGAQLRDDLSGFSIVHIVEGGPGSGKLKIGDKIIAVNQQPIVGMDITEAIDLIRGPKGSSLVLTVIRQINEINHTLDIHITREEIVLKENRFSSYTEPFGNGMIGYLALHSFYEDPKNSSYKDLRNALETMKQQHRVHGVILDLRDNAGGLLPQAIEVASLFIKKGAIASIKDHMGKIQRLRNLREEAVWKGPLIILTNRASASAAEIVALSLSDYGRALIVGDASTYGKGSYQTFSLQSSFLEKINPQGEYKVTRGIYYTVGGKSPQLTGVKADIEVPGLLNFLEMGEKYAKYPLDNDTIAPFFQDDLSDIHHIPYRIRLRKFFETNCEKKTLFFQTFVPLLADHSQKRIQKSKPYQNFLQHIQQTNPSTLDTNTFGQNDLQLEEVFHMMKELIFLSQKG